MYGQLGHGDKSSYRTPKQVEALHGTGVVNVVAGEDFTLAILEDDRLVSDETTFYNTLNETFNVHW